MPNPQFAICNPNTHEHLGNAVSGRGIKTWDDRTISDATLRSRADNLADGLIPITDPCGPDGRLYTVTHQDVAVDWPDAALVYTAEAIPAAEIRADRIAAIKAQAAGMLTGTDWMVIRAAEGGTALPAAVATYRAAVRAASNAAEAAIIAAGDDAAAILAVTPAWPETLKTEG
jgi:hypothetical protein